MMPPHIWKIQYVHMKYYYEGIIQIMTILVARLSPFPMKNIRVSYLEVHALYLSLFENFLSLLCAQKFCVICFFLLVAHSMNYIPSYPTYRQWTHKIVASSNYQDVWQPKLLPHTRMGQCPQP